MTDQNDIIDVVKQRSPENKLFRVMAMLSYIGNCIWGFFFLFLFIACIINGALLANSESFNAIFNGLIVLFAILSFVIVVLCVLSIIGMYRLQKGKHSGFVLYAIANTLWAIIIIYASKGSWGYIIPGVISAGFVLYFGFYTMQLKWDQE